VVEFDSDYNAISIEEKPTQPKSNYAVPGLYFYDNKVFSYINHLKPSERGQLEITEVNNKYLQADMLQWAKLNGFWSDAGTFMSLHEANSYWAKKHGGNDE
jgi:glucose-1-phosphate thymidylyltransferase